MDSTKKQISDDGKIDADKALTKLGVYGRYQLLLFVLVSSCWIFCAFQVMAIAVISGDQNFGCTLKEDQKLLIAKNEGYSKSNNSNFSNSSAAAELWNRKCSLNTSSNNESVCGADSDTKFVFDQIYGRTINEEWSLVCSRDFLAPFASSLFMFGNLAGAGIVTQFADRFGRRWTLMITTWAMGIFGVLSGVMPNIYAFSVMKFFAGLCYAGSSIISWVLGCEVIAPLLRDWSATMMGTLWTTGYLLLGVVAYFIQDWRPVVIVTSASTFLTLSFYWLVPESPHWLVANGRQQEARQWVERAAKFNNVNVTPQDCFVEENDIDPKPEPQKRTILHLFIKPILLFFTLNMAFIWMTNSFVYYGLSLFSTNLAGDKYTNFILLGLAELPAYWIIGPMMKYWGRRLSLALFHVLAGVALLVIMFFDDLTVTTILYVLGKFAISGSYGIVFLYGAELFPTTVRSAALGICGVASKFGGVLAPQIKILKDVSEYLPPSLFGAFSLIAGLLALTLPETMGKPLPEDDDDLDPGPFLARFLKKKKPSVIHRTQEEIERMLPNITADKLC